MNAPTNADDLAQLERQLARVEADGLRSLRGDELLEFGHRYRRAAAALSAARSQGVDDAAIAYLNQLVARAYGHLYVSEPRGLPSVRRFFAHEFPRCFRRNLLFIAAAFLMTFGAALFAYGVVSRDAGTADVVLGPGTTEMMEQIAARHTGQRNWMPEEARPLMSSFIMANNVRVAALAFAAGVLGGVFTFAILFHNGLMLGVVAAAVAARGPAVMLSFWGFVAPHGVIELMAIFIAGGAGLMLGWAVIHPGDYTRAAALKLAGRDAFTLVVGVVAMLVVAGIIEGFFSPAMLPESLKLTTAAVLGTAEFCYLFLTGVEEPKAAPRASTSGTGSRRRPTAPSG